jgi:monoamine oxidase
LKEGIGGLLTHLSADLAPLLHLNSPALKFSRKSDGIEIQTPHNPFLAKDVIVAVPPHLYKQMGLYEVITPEIQSEIEFFQPGLAVKTILVFEKPWWRETGLTGRSISGDGLFTATLDASPADNSYGVLVLFSTSTSGTLLSKMDSEAERVKAAIKWLESFGSMPIPKLLSSKSVNWNAGPVALGGYASAPTLGGRMKRTELFNSIEGLHFAGTETATEWSSFMEGALQSAERAVARI